MERRWGKIALLTVPLIVGLGSLMGYLSQSGYDNRWFDALVEPPFMPPAWLFGVVWTILYALLGVAVAMILALPSSKERRDALILFFVQLALNFAWSPLFFAAHDMKGALILIMVMLVIAVFAAKKFYALRPLAGVLLFPYLGWLIFATVLNQAFVNLNPHASQSLLATLAGG